jgi:hypothetical protein
VQPVYVDAMRHERCVAEGFTTPDGVATCELLLDLYAEQAWQDRLAEIERRRLEREELFDD